MQHLFRIPTFMLLLIGLITSMIGCAAVSSSDPPESLRMENLRQQPLDPAFTPHREIVVSYVEIPPNTTMDRHWHPGEEFHYYLEGHVTIAIDDHPDIDGSPGTVGHVPFRKMHTAVTGHEGATVLVFRVHTEGEPVRYLEDGGAADR